MKHDSKTSAETITSQASTPGKEAATSGMLRFLTCGSVDDGKSTVIGRLLYDSRLVVEDHLEALHRDSAKSGTTGDEPDLALLVDGLQAEREQGITIDVAYRYFATSKRKFIVADTPGHEQYTRNMATGASVSDCAIILVDAQKGLLTQTRRHSSIVHLLGIRHVVLAVNKMDLVDCSQERFEEICRAYMDFAGKLGISDVQAVPLAARDGDNVVRRSDRMAWYKGPTLLEYLETIDVETAEDAAGFCLPVQWVNRRNAEFRGYTGTVSSGTLTPGKPVVVLPSGRTTKIREILTADGPLPSAPKGRAVTVVLEDEVDVSRGDVLVDPTNRPTVSDQVAADVIWMGDEPLLPGRRYIMKCGTQTLSGTVTTLKHKLDVDLLDESAARDLTLNEIGLCNISFSRPIVIAPYLEESVLGSFLIIDRLTNATVGVGLIRFGLRRADNVHWQALDVDKATRAATIGQRPVCIWFTGLSGSGKSTIANLLEKKLLVDGRHTYTLDGDNVRHGLNRDLGFTDADRVENIRRVAEVSKLMVDAGMIVLVSFISPFRAERQMAREMLEDGEFLEVFVDTPLEICEDRDTKGLYRKARQGLIKNFTGIDSAYEEPEKPECRLDTAAASAEDLADYLFEQLRSRGIV